MMTSRRICGHSLRARLAEKEEIIFDLVIYVISVKEEGL
jgi:hypothetical protein